MASPLEAWWYRHVDNLKRETLPVYPLPHDGASFAVMSNFFSVVGFGDDRVVSKEMLNVLVFMSQNTIKERFLELWPKSKPEWMKEPKQELTLQQNIETLKSFFEDNDVTIDASKWLAETEDDDTP